MISQKKPSDINGCSFASSISSQALSGTEWRGGGQAVIAAINIRREAHRQ